MLMNRRTIDDVDLFSFRMSSNVFGRVFTSTANTVFKRFVVTLLKTLLIYTIALFFVHLPSLWNTLMAWGKDDEKQDRQRRVRAQLVDPSDSSSAYRALEVLDQLQTQPDEQIQTLADIPDYCLQRYADRETLGVREIRDVEDEEQPNGKVFKKVSSLIVTRHTVDLCLSLSVSFSSSSWVNISSALIEKLTVASRPSVEAFFHSVSDTMTRYSSSRRPVPNGY